MFREGEATQPEEVLEQADITGPTKHYAVCCGNTPWTDTGAHTLESIE